MTSAYLCTDKDTIGQLSSFFTSPSKQPIIQHQNDEEHFDEYSGTPGYCWVHSRSFAPCQGWTRNHSENIHPHIRLSELWHDSSGLDSSIFSKLFIIIFCLGQVNLKICGGAPEACCSIVNIGDFDSNMFNEGQIDNYTGDHQLEDCFNYTLEKISSPAEFDLTVYHEGSDGGQLDWIEVATTNTTVRCPLGRFAVL